MFKCVAVCLNCFTVKVSNRLLFGVKLSWQPLTTSPTFLGKLYESPVAIKAIIIKTNSGKSFGQNLFCGSYVDSDSATYASHTTV